MNQTSQDELGKFTSVFSTLQSNSDQFAFGETFEAISDSLVKFHQSFFANQSSPGGDRWAPLSPITIARKGHATILVETDSMRRSVAGRRHQDHIESFSTNEMSWGTKDEKAAFHQYGTSRMPARPFVGWSDESIDSAVELVADAAVEQLLAGL